MGNRGMGIGSALKEQKVVEEVGHGLAYRRKQGGARREDVLAASQRSPKDPTLRSPPLGYPRQAPFAVPAT
jgi:hypothetical protein